MSEWIVAFLLITGGFFIFVAGLGVFRMPDTLIRMHASTKAGTLGVGLILIALMIVAADTAITARAAAAIIFLLITGPVAAHMIGRAVYQTGTPLWNKNVVDEWHSDKKRRRQSRKPAKKS